MKNFNIIFEFLIFCLSKKFDNYAHFAVSRIFPRMVTIQNLIKIELHILTTKKIRKHSQIHKVLQFSFMSFLILKSLHNILIINITNHVSFKILVRYHHIPFVR